MNHSITELKQTPFGTSLVSNVLWKELSYLKKSHREYVLSIYNEFCVTVKQLYNNKILGKEILIDLLYSHNLNKVNKYLTGDSYTYFCNVMHVRIKEQKKRER